MLPLSVLVAQVSMRGLLREHNVAAMLLHVNLGADESLHILAIGEPRLWECGKMTLKTCFIQSPTHTTFEKHDSYTKPLAHSFVGSFIHSFIRTVIRAHTDALPLPQRSIGGLRPPL